MNRLLTFLLVFASCFTARAALPTFQNFDQDHFLTNGTPATKKIQIRAPNLWTNDNSISGGGAYGRLTPAPGVNQRYLYPTNFYGYGWFGLEPQLRFLTPGTTAINTTDFSSWILFSTDSDPANVSITLTDGNAFGQELKIMSMTNTPFNGKFTLAANSALPGGGVVKLNFDQDWYGMNGASLDLVWMNPDWWETGRWHAGTNAAFFTTNVFNTIQVTNLTVISNITVRGKTIIVDGTNVALMNPTIGRLPFKETTNAFGDSPLIRVNATTIGIDSLTNLLYRAGSDFVLENDDATGFELLLEDVSGNSASYGVNGNGAPRITSTAAGQPVILTAGGEGDGLYVTVNSLQPGAETMAIGAASSSGAWVTQWFKGTLHQQGLNDGLGNRESLDIFHDTTNAVFNSTANGTGTARDFLWQSNGVTIAKLALNSGYTGAGTLFLSDDGTFKVAGGGGGGASNWTNISGVLQPIAGSSVLVSNLNIGTSAATAIPLVIEAPAGHTNWLARFSNGATNYIMIDEIGQIGIGLTNIFADKDIGITRIADREGSPKKAWINLGGIDTWPTYNHASEWWCNTGTNDAIMEMTWLSSTAIAPQKAHIWSVGTADASTYYKYQYDGTNRFQIDSDGDVETAGSLKLSGQTDALTVAGGVLLIDGVPVSPLVNNSGLIEPLGGQLTNVLRFTSGLADNATNASLIVDTVGPWESQGAAIAKFKSGGTNYVTLPSRAGEDRIQFHLNDTVVAGITPWGGLWKGPSEAYVNSYWGALGGHYNLIGFRLKDLDGDSYQNIYIESAIDTNTTQHSFFNVDVIAEGGANTYSSIDLRGQGTSRDERWSLRASGVAGTPGYFRFGANDSIFSLKPGIADGAGATAHTIGSLNALSDPTSLIARFHNNTVTKFTVSFDGTLGVISAIVTNNIGAKLTVGDTTFVDVSRASQTNSVTGALTFAHATNGVHGLDLTHVRWIFVPSGGPHTLTVPALWRTNVYSAVPPALTNGTIYRMVVACGGETATAAAQTNAYVSFEMYK